MTVGLIQFRATSAPVTITYVAIDGGPTYYADYGFSPPVNAGYDAATFFEIGAWPSWLLAAQDYARFQRLGYNTAYLVTSNSDKTLAGAGSGIYWVPMIAEAAQKPFVQTAGPEIIGYNVFDEPTDWNTQIVAIVNGTSAASALNGASNATTALINRPLYLGFETKVLNAGITNAPVSGSPAGFFYTNVSDPGGNQRYMNLTGFDQYWTAASSDTAGFCSPQGSLSQMRGLGGPDPAQVDHHITVAGGTLAVPTSFPIDITFTTDPGIPIQLGTCCSLQCGGNKAIIGTVTAYVTQTGACTIHVVDGHTYTCSWGSGGPNGSSLQFQVNSVDGFVFRPLVGDRIITDVTSSGRIPGGTLYQGTNASASLNQAATATAWTFFTSAACTVAIGDTVKLADTVGSGSDVQGNWRAHFALTTDQCRRAIHYGDFIDAQRGWQYPGPNPPTRHPAPLLQYIETGGAYYTPGSNNSAGANAAAATAAEYPTPMELNQNAWCTIMHGARKIVWFDVVFGGTQSNAGGYFTGGAYPDTVVTLNNYFGVPNTISVDDQIRLTNTCIKKFAPVINSRFAAGFATVSPNGFSAPYGGSFVQNDGPSYVATGTYNNDLAVLDGNDLDSFEITVKYYEGSTTGYFTHNQYWIIAAYRGSLKRTNKTATFQMAIGTANVTRFFMDAVITAAASGNSPGDKTRITCSDTSQMIAGDTAIFENTTGFTIAGSSPNGVSFTISTIVDGTHFEVPGVFGGSSPGGSSPGVVLGQVTVQHTIPVTGGGFTDVFIKGTDIRIYRVN